MQVTVVLGTRQGSEGVREPYGNIVVERFVEIP